MSKTMNEENGWDQIAETDTVQGQIERVMREEIMETFKRMKIGQTPEVNAEIILASGDNGIRVLMAFCKRMHDEKGMPSDWSTRVAIHIFKGKGDIMNCDMSRGEKLLERAIIIVEKGT